MSKTATGHFEILDGFPNDVVAVSAKGRISGHHYETMLIPLVRERIRIEGRIKIFYELGPEFKGLTAGAAWDDAKLGLLHMPALARIAVVSDLEWIRLGIRMFAPMMPCPVHVFHVTELDAAKAWIVKDRDEKASGPRVAAAHKLSLLEDKIPPAD